MDSLFGILYISLISIYSTNAWSDSKKVKLNDIKTLTLYSGKYTTGRRSNPVPQVHCIGGSAGCTSFVPQVVQCYNRGSDGLDVQWECKADMDNAFRFGEISVSCEGYDYPDDPYVLKGSCGLEYKLELTKEGMHKHGSNQYGSSYDYYKSYPSKSKNSFSDLFFFGIICLLIYAIYRSCLRRHQYSSTDDDNDYPDSSFRSGGHGGFGYPSGGPPPPGFRPGYTPDDSCHSSARSTAGGNPFGGFWSGAAAGSVLGYMFGNRNNDAYYARPTSGWGGGGFSGFSGPSTSSGTRTSSGFGGTSRR